MLFRSALVRTLTGHTDRVRSVSFSPDGSLLASGSKDGTIKLWRVSDGALVRTLTGHTGFVRSVSFSPDGRLLASGSHDHTIKLWRVSDGSLVRTLTGHTGFVRSVSFSPDGSLLASGSGDKTIKLWRVSDGSLVRTLTGHTNWVWRQMVRAVRWGGVDLTGHTNWVWSVSFSPDGSLLASGGDDKTIKLWRVSDGALVRTLTGHTDRVRSVSFSPDGSLLASGSDDKTIKLWSTTATQSVPAGQVHTAPRSTPALQSAPSSQPSGYAPTPPPTPTPAQASRRRYGAWVWSVLAILLIGLCVINLLPDGSPVRTLKESKQGGEDDARTLLPPVRTLTGHTSWVRSVSFSPDGRLLASGSDDKTINLWRVSDGALVRTLTGHTYWVFSEIGRASCRERVCVIV